MDVLVIFATILAQYITLGAFSQRETRNHLTQSNLTSRGSNKRILGGHEIEIEDIPFQVSVQSLSGVHFCGGAIISERWVITAGQCVCSSTAPNVTVRVGTTYHDRGGQVIHVAESVRHPLYAIVATFDYDFSLLKLKQSLVQTELARPVQLPAKDVFLQDGTMCMVSGWGDTLNPAEANDRLRATDVALVNDALCQTAYLPFGTITEQMLCAGYHTGGRDACQGDAGGPLFYENTLIGIVSWGKGCAVDGQLPGVYGRVTSVRTWIEKVSGV